MRRPANAAGTFATGCYEGPFDVPRGVRLVLAVAEKDGIESELHQREIAEKPEPRPIDPTRPVVWSPERGFTFQTTRTAYGFIGRLKKHDVSASGLRLSAQADRTWVELSLSDDIELGAAAMEEAVEHLRRLVSGGEVEIRASRTHYATGQCFLDHMAEIKATYRRDEVEP